MHSVKIMETKPGPHVTSVLHGNGSTNEWASTISVSKSSELFQSEKKSKCAKPGGIIERLDPIQKAATLWAIEHGVVFFGLADEVDGKLHETSVTNSPVDRDHGASISFN